MHICIFLDIKPENPEKMCLHRQNMQTPCKMTPDWDSNPGFSRYKVSVAITAPPFSL